MIKINANNLFIFILLSIVLITSSCTLASADVDDIDADVIANAVYIDAPGDYDVATSSLDVDWTATYSGYLYIFMYDDYLDPAGQTTINSMTGTPGDKVDLGLIDDTGFLGSPVRAWRIGYVYNGTAYSMSGSFYEPGSDTCGQVAAVFQDTDGFSYSGGYTGHELSLYPGVWNACAGDIGPLTFLLIETPPPESTLSGYVTDAEGDPLDDALVTLNKSIGTVYTNEIGFYEFTGLEEGSYLFTIEKPTQQDYSDTLSISVDTEKNVSMTRLLPALISGPWILDESQSSLNIGWTENSVVDSALIYQGSNSNLIYTMDTSYTAINSYTVRSLTCGSPYDFWVQPMDGVVAGSKYEVSCNTDSCDVSALPPIINPTPTEIPDDDEEDGGDEGDDDEGIIEVIDDIIEVINEIIEVIDEIIEDGFEIIEDSIIEPTKVIIEEIIVHVSSTFNWILLIFVYLAVLGARMMNGENDMTTLIVETVLYGTIAMILILLLSVVGFSFIFLNEIVTVIIFLVIGFGVGMAPEILKN